MTILSFKQLESNYGKKEPCKCSGLLSFLIVWIFDAVDMVLFFQFAVHAALMKKKICEVNDFQCFFKKGSFHFVFFSRKISFPFKCRKAIFQRFRRLKNQKFPLHMNHGHNTDFSKLVNLCPVKTFSLSLTPATHIMNQCWGLNATISKTNTFIYTAICVAIVSKDLFLYSTDSQIT